MQGNAKALDALPGLLLYAATGAGEGLRVGLLELGGELGGEPGGDPGERGWRGEAMDAHASWVRASDSSSACRGSSELIQGRAGQGCSGAVGERE